MRIIVKSHGFSVSDAIRTHVERRIFFSLGRFADQISVVNVRLDDVNGPRNGIDKRCRVQVKSARLGGLMNEDIDVDLYVAVNRATERVARSFGRALARKRDRDEAVGALRAVRARSLLWIEVREAAG